MWPPLSPSLLVSNSPIPHSLIVTNFMLKLYLALKKTFLLPRFLLHHGTGWNKSRSRSIEYMESRNRPGPPPTIYYTCFADGTPFEKEFYKGRLPFFKCDFFTYHIQKIDFYIIKKYVCIANNFASQKKGFFLGFFALSPPPPPV